MELDLKGKTNMEAALAYAATGFPVFPLHTPRNNGGCSCGNPGCTSKGKHPRTANGVKDATTDPETIKKMWNNFPDANTGIACGESARICVVDVDPIHGGNESLVRLEEQYGALPETLRARTGSGCQHVFFKYPGEDYKNCNRGEIGDGIDF